jgi:Protein of unknown function (DUF2723)
MKRALPALREAARVACDLAAFAIPAIVFVTSVSHDPGEWDTAELQGVPYILGISHPTGFPAYMLLGYAWSHVVSVGTIAFRMNAMSALAIAVAAAVAYAVALELGAPRLVALGATLWFAFTQDIWSHANRAEAQDLALMLSAFAIYAFLRWMKGGSDRWCVGACALFGVSLAAHPNAIWVFPGFIAGALAVRRRVSLRLALACAATIVAGLSLYLYLPLRSWYIVTHGLDPAHVLLGSAGGLFWNYNSPYTWPGLILELTGNESGVPGFFLASFNPIHLQDALAAFVSGTDSQFGAFALVLAAIGLVFAWKRDWRVALFLCIACTAALLFAVTYSREGDLGRYRMLSLWLVVPLIAAAAPRRDDIASGFGRAALAVFLAIGALGAFRASDSFFNHAPNEGGRWVIDAVRPYVPRGSALLVDWLDGTSLAYGAYDDGTLAGRIIVSGWEPRDMRLYQIWARDRRVFILVNPTTEAVAVPGTHPGKILDPYHQLLEVNPAK